MPPGLGPISFGRLMLTYFYIALGGAIGSVVRAWTTNVMVRVVGANFPWGTILINVAGSFIIGFFGALTASDGRLQVHADARAFVMIGICGGSPPSPHSACKPSISFATASPAAPSPTSACRSFCA